MECVSGDLCRNPTESICKSISALASRPKISNGESVQLVPFCCYGLVGQMLTTPSGTFMAISIPHQKDESCALSLFKIPLLL